MQKVIGPLELKADAPGTFRATIATLGVVDRDGDVAFSGAFPIGKNIIVSAYGHGSWRGGTAALPVGKGVIGADDSTAWLDGRFILETSNGGDTYRTVKHLGPLQEWSYAFDVTEGITPIDPRLQPYPTARRGLLKLDVHEVSPVLRGAGIGTRTEYVKRAAAPRVDAFSAEQRELQRLYDDFQRFQLTEMKRDLDDMLAEIALDENGPGYVEVPAREVPDYLRIKGEGAVLHAAVDLWHPRPPVRWFAEAGPGETPLFKNRPVNGMFMGGEVWLNVDADDVVKTAHHEVWHCARADDDRRTQEREAREYGHRMSAAYYQR